MYMPPTVDTLSSDKLKSVHTAAELAAFLDRVTRHMTGIVVEGPERPCVQVEWGRPIELCGGGSLQLRISTQPPRAVLRADSPGAPKIEFAALSVRKEVAGTVHVATVVLYGEEIVARAESDGLNFSSCSPLLGVRFRCAPVRESADDCNGYTRGSVKPSQTARAADERQNLESTDIEPWTRVASGRTPALCTDAVDDAPTVEHAVDLSDFAAGIAEQLGFGDTRADCARKVRRWHQGVIIAQLLTPLSLLSLGSSASTWQCLPGNLNAACGTPVIFAFSMWLAACAAEAGADTSGVGAERAFAASTVAGEMRSSWPVVHNCKRGVRVKLALDQLVYLVKRTLERELGRQALDALLRPFLLTGFVLCHRARGSRPPPRQRDMLHVHDIFAVASGSRRHASAFDEMHERLLVAFSSDEAAMNSVRGLEQHLRATAPGTKPGATPAFREDHCVAASSFLVQTISADTGLMAELACAVDAFAGAGAACVACQAHVSDAELLLSPRAATCASCDGPRCAACFGSAARASPSPRSPSPPTWLCAACARSA